MQCLFGRLHEDESGGTSRLQTYLLTLIYFTPFWGTLLALGRAAFCPCILQAAFKQGP